jgi:hypothetical protein
MIGKVLGLLFAGVVVFFVVGCWMNASENQAAGATARLLHEPFANNTSDTEKPPATTIPPSSATATPPAKPHARHLADKARAQATHYDSLIKKKAEQDAAYDDAYTDQKLESHHQQLADKHERLARNHRRHRQTHDGKWATANRRWKQHVTKIEALDRQTQKKVSVTDDHARAIEVERNHHAKRAADLGARMKLHVAGRKRHHAKASQHAAWASAGRRKQAEHRAKKDAHLRKGHNTHHDAYPEHYADEANGHTNDWDAQQHRDETVRRQQDVRNAAPHSIREIDPDHARGFRLEQPTTYDVSTPHDHLQQYGHTDYPPAVWSTPQNGSPTCLPSVELERKPVHLGNTYGTPADDFSVGYLLPRFRYEEVRAY